MVETAQDDLWNGNTETPALFASRCRDCGARHFPVRRICGQCHSANQEKIALSPRGTVFASCHIFSKKQTNYEVAYTVGYVLLEDGVLVPARICFPGRPPEVGVPVILAAEPGGFPDGKQKQGYYFKPEFKGD